MEMLQGRCRLSITAVKQGLGVTCCSDHPFSFYLFTQTLLRCYLLSYSPKCVLLSISICCCCGTFCTQASLIPHPYLAVYYVVILSQQLRLCASLLFKSKQQNPQFTLTHESVETRGRGCCWVYCKPKPLLSIVRSWNIRPKTLSIKASTPPKQGTKCPVNGQIENSHNGG